MMTRQTTRIRRGGRLPATLGWVMVGLMAGGLASCDGQKKVDAGKKPAPETQPAGGTDWTYLFDGKTLNNWKIPDWGASGKVHVKDGCLHMESGETCTGVTYTGEVIRDNYEISLEGMRVEGMDFFIGLTFPVGKNPMSLICGGWSGMVTGLSSLEDNDASNNETAKYIEYKNNKWYRINLRVTPQAITVDLDDKEIINVLRKGRRIDIRSEMEPCLPLGLATWQTHGAIRNLKVRKLSPTGL